MTAAAFWETTLAEWSARLDGWNRSQRGGLEPMDRERLDDLIAEYGVRSKSVRKKR